MRFRLTIDATFEAENMEDAMEKINRRFPKDQPEEDGTEYLKMDGSIKVSPVVEDFHTGNGGQVH